MRDVYLHGSLGDQFGKKHRFAIESAPEAFQALAANFPEIIEAFRFGMFKVIAGPRKTGEELSEQTIVSRDLSEREALHVVPVVKGSKQGLGTVLAGVALVGLAFATGGTALMSASILGSTTTLGGILTSVGTSMVLTGVASMIAPELKFDGSGSEENQSFTMSGPQVVTREGGIVPIVYGQVITGGVMISGALEVDTRALT